MSLHLGEITWETLAAIATLAAVIVALIPIWRDARRHRGHARSLRIRLCAKLTLLRPSLDRVVQHGFSKYPAAVLTKEEFREAVRSIGAMMQESSVLETEEQDSLGLTFVNLEMTAGLYNSTELTADLAGTILRLIDKSISVMQTHGLVHGPVETPWENER